MLANLLRTSDDSIQHHVCTMLADEVFFDLGGRLSAGPTRSRRASLGIVRHLLHTASWFRPNVVHGWMYHANLATLLLRRQTGSIVWSIHSSGLLPGFSQVRTMLVDKALAKLSRRIPARIVYVTEQSRKAHEAVGYAANKSVVIPNGIDLARFDPGRFPSRREGAGLSRPVVVAMVARVHPEKGHDVLIEALSDHPLKDRIELVLVGRGVDTDRSIAARLDAAGLLGRSRLLGEVARIEDVYASADIVVLPSYAEGLPLTLLEAMAMGCLIVASRVGEIPQIGLDPDLLFEPGDRQGCQRALAEAVERLPVAAAELRDTIARRYDLKQVAARYSALYREIA